MKGDQLYLRHILEAIEKIESYKRPSQDLRSQHHEIPWRRIAGLRDVLIHDYMGVDLPAVWEITQRELPVLKKHVRMILEKLGNAK